MMTKSLIVLFSSVLILQDLYLRAADYYVALNGDFEGRQANGEPVSRQPHANPGVSIQDAKLAASGSWLVKVAHDRRFAQTLRLTPGQIVTVRALERGLPVQQTE